MEHDDLEQDPSVPSEFGRAFLAPALLTSFALCTAVLVLLWVRREKQRDHVMRERIRRRALALESQECELHAMQHREMQAKTVRKRGAEGSSVSKTRSENKQHESVSTLEGLEGKQLNAFCKKRLDMARRTGILNFLPAPLFVSMAELAPTLRVVTLVDARVQDEHLESLAANLFPRLSALELSGNQITQLWQTHEPWATPSLQRLVITRNSTLTQLPQSGWQQVIALRELHVSRCGLCALCGEVGQLSALQLLDVSHNALRALPPEIGGLYALKDLNLSANLIAALPAEMAGMTRLRRLNVEDNMLSTLPRHVLEIDALESIRVRGNDLMVLKETEGVDSYLERRRRRIVEDGRVLSFCDLEIRHQKEMEKRGLK